MPARRDYADAWRDSWVTLAQLPVAGLLATDYFCQQWVERSSTYLAHVSARLALARPAGAGGASGDSVMADVLSEDLVEETRALVRDLVSLPGLTATFFNRHLEDLVNGVLTRIQPDAQKNARTYVVNELEKVNRELLRLREVASAEAAREDLAAPGGRAPDPDPRRALDEEALANLLETIKAVADDALQQPRGGRESAPHQRLPDVLHAIVQEALKRFSPEAPGAQARPAPPDVLGEGATALLLALRRARDRLQQEQRDIDQERGGGERATRLLLAMQRAQVELEQARRAIDDQIEGTARTRTRRETSRTRR